MADHQDGEDRLTPQWRTTTDIEAVRSIYRQLQEQGWIQKPEFRGGSDTYFKARLIKSILNAIDKGVLPLAVLKPLWLHQGPYKKDERWSDTKVTLDALSDEIHGIWTELRATSRTGGVGRKPGEN